VPKATPETVTVQFIAACDVLGISASNPGAASATLRVKRRRNRIFSVSV
jgi:hypothetical protein